MEGSLYDELEVTGCKIRVGAAAALPTNSNSRNSAYVASSWCCLDEDL